MFLERHHPTLETKSEWQLPLLPQRGEEGQPHQSLVRTTFSSFSRPNQIEILDLSILFFLSVRSLKINTFFKNMATLGHKT